MKVVKLNEVVEIEKYESVDGKLWSTKQSCIYHERDLVAKKQPLSFRECVELLGESIGFFDERDYCMVLGGDARDLLECLHRHTQEERKLDDLLSYINRNINRLKGYTRHYSKGNEGSLCNYSYNKGKIKALLSLASVIQDHKNGDSDDS